MVDARKPVYFDIDDAYVVKHKSAIRAIKSLREGRATEAQQLLALDYILTVLCDRAGNQFYPTDRDSTFAMGRKFVGDHIVGAINVPITSKEKAND
jgi:hypothetical protein